MNYWTEDCIVLPYRHTTEMEQIQECLLAVEVEVKANREKMEVNQEKLEAIQGKIEVN
jgi:hypothetical protein